MTPLILTIGFGFCDRSCRRTFVLRLVSFCAVALLVLIPFAGAQPEDSSAPGVLTLRTAAEIRLLGNTPSGLAKPVRLQGVVTFVHTPSQTIFLSDATGGILVTRSDQRLPLPAAGESVMIAGTTAPGTRFPTVQAAAIQVAEKVGLPPAREITFEQALSGTEDAQWVKINGQLRQIETLEGWLRLVLETPQGDFSVSIPTLERPAFVVGDLLQVRGVCSVWLVTASLRIGGFFLYAPTLAEVQVMAGSTASPGVLTSVKQVRNLRTDEAKGGRAVQLHGVVTFAHADQRIFYLNDNTGGLIVWLPDHTLPLPAVGTLVSVRGHTNAGVFSATVQCDLMQTGAAQPLPTPRPVSLEQALTGSEDSQWVEMRGHLRQVETGSNWLRLKLTSAVGEFTVSPTSATGRIEERKSLIQRTSTVKVGPTPVGFLGSGFSAGVELATRVRASRAAF